MTFSHLHPLIDGHLWDLGYKFQAPKGCNYTLSYGQNSVNVIEVNGKAECNCGLGDTCPHIEMLRRIGVIQ